MKQDLIDRYVYAVTRRLPARLRSDIDQELRSLIDDMLEARCGGILPRERDIRVVLTELGTPAELAAQYTPEGRNQLIGPAYYDNYKTIVSIVLAAVTLGLVVSGFISILQESQEVWYVTLFSGIGTLIIGLISAFGMVTLIFAVFERKNIALNLGGSDLDSLPPVPQKKAVISKSEALAGIVFSVIFCVIFLAAPQIICVKLGDSQPFIPVFNLERIHQLWYLFAGFAILGICNESFKLYEGRYTRRLALVTLVTNLLSAGLTVIFLSDSRILNSAFIDAVIKNSGHSASNTFLAHFNLFFMTVILLALLIETGVTLFKGFWYER